MGTAIAAIVTQVLASPALQKFIKWAAWTLFVAVFFFVKGCTWKAGRIEAATIRRPDRVIVQPRRPLLPIIRRVEPVPQSQPSEPQPVPGPSSTPEAPQGEEPTQEPAAVVDPVIDAIQDAATKPLPKSNIPAAKQDACGPDGCSTGNCNQRPAGGGYTFQRRGLFGRMW